MVQVARSGMRRNDEARMLKEALNLNNKQNFLPVDRISLGDFFAKIVIVEKIPAADLNRIQHNCGQYIFRLCNDLLDKLSSNLNGVEKLRFLMPRIALSRTARPTFQQLQAEIAGKWYVFIFI